MQAGNDASVSTSTAVEMELVKLGEELAELKKEVQTIKKALKYQIARYEIDQVKKGKNLKSILSLSDMEN